MISTLASLVIVTVSASWITFGRRLTNIAVSSCLRRSIAITSPCQSSVRVPRAERSPGCYPRMPLC